MCVCMRAHSLRTCAHVCVCGACVRMFVCVCMCMCICAHVCVYVCMWCMCAHVCVCMCMWCMCAHVCACVCVCVCVHIHKKLTHISYVLFFFKDYQELPFEGISDL